MSKKDRVHSVRFTPEEYRFASDLCAELDCSLSQLLVKSLMMSSGIFRQSPDMLHRIQLADFSEKE